MNGTVLGNKRSQVVSELYVFEENSQVAGLLRFSPLSQALMLISGLPWLPTEVVRRHGGVSAIASVLSV